MLVRRMSRSFVGSLALVLIACSSSNSDEGTPRPSDVDAGDIDAAHPAHDRDRDAGSDAGHEDATTTNDTSPPVVEILSPRDDLAFDERRIVVTGSAKDDVGIAELTILVGTRAPVAVPVAADGSFVVSFEPDPGSNTVTLTAKDASGNSTQATRTAYFGHRVSVGNSQAALLANGKIYTWGRNELGQLGNGTLVGTWSADTSAALPAMYERNAPELVSIVTRQTSMIALAKDGSVQTWGANGSGQLGYTTPADCGSKANTACGRTAKAVPGITDAVAIAAGFDHTLVLRKDGTVLAFGSNDSGQIGQPATVASTNAPTEVPGLTDVIAIAAGSSHSIALTKAGKVYVWGNNQQGQLGLGTTDKDPHPTPTLVDGVTGLSIASCNNTVLVRTADKHVVTWGQNNNGQIGNGTTTAALKPTQVLVSAATDTAPAKPLTGIDSIAGDGFVSLALDDKGVVYAWGMGSLGQLGQGLLGNGDRDLANRSVASPVYVDPADKSVFDVVEIEVGAGGPAFAWTKAHKLFGWGWSFQGSLGGGTSLINAWAYTTPFLVFPTP